MRRIALPVLLLIAGCSGGGEDSVTGTEHELTDNGRERDETDGACASWDDCAADEHCAWVAGACGVDGACRQLETTCPAAEAPVCGCDGATYPGRCVAGQHGVSVAYEGACPPPQSTPPPPWVGPCGGSDCGAGEYCD